MRGLLAGAAGRPLKGRKAVVTAGPTFEPIDPVRGLTNRSSGKQGYAIAAASVGVRHKIIRQYQIEPNAYAGTSATFNDDYYIFHYTYGIEYRLDGRPPGFHQIGARAVDTRHYGGS